SRAADGACAFRCAKAKSSSPTATEPSPRGCAGSCASRSRCASPFRGGRSTRKKSKREMAPKSWRIDIALRRTNNSEHQESAEHGSRNTRMSKSIALIEDERDVAELVRHTLEREGFS